MKDQESNFFDWTGSSLLLSTLCDMPPKSKKHRQILTTVLLCLNLRKKCDKGFFQSCLSEIQLKRWSVDYSFIRYVCRKGTPDMKIGLLQTTLSNFCTPRQRYQLIQDCVRTFKDHEYYNFMLGDMLRGALPHPAISRKERDRLIDRFLAYKSVRVRRMGILCLESIKWPTVHQSKKMINGLFSSSSSMRTDSVNTLASLVLYSEQLSKTYGRLLITLKVIPALKKLKRMERIYSDLVDKLIEKLSSPTER